jgi:hypothetical protein
VINGVVVFAQKLLTAGQGVEGGWLDIEVDAKLPVAPNAGFFAHNFVDSVN